ncbi:MAG: lipase family protein [Pseudomonadota bacterium]
MSEHFTSVKAGTDYDPDVALSLAIACDLGYKSKTTVKKFTKQWGYECLFHGVTKGQDIDTQCYVMANDTDTICVFRGSDDIKDWFANFQAVRDPGPFERTRAHKGFQDTLDPAVIATTNAIDKINGPTKRLCVIGHSPGGALGSRYDGMILENGYEVYGIYIFSSPHPGDEDFAQALNAAMGKGSHHRVVIDGDIVPHVPPEPFDHHVLHDPNKGSISMLKNDRNRRQNP